jgi:error-prone DNA polymerase
MSPEEASAAERWATGISVNHPVMFIREWLVEQGCWTTAEALARQKHGVIVRIGGIVTHRQRPGTASGVIFFNLEDETGLLNVVVLPDVWAANHLIARRNPGLVIDGVLEYRDGVTNLVARSFTPFPTLHTQSRNFR